MFCAVCAVSFDMDFLSGFGCFWFGTLTEEGTEKQRRVQFCNFLPRLFVIVAVVIFSLVCLKFWIRCAFSVCVCDFRGYTKGLIQKSAPWFFQHVFGPWHQHLQVCFHFKGGRVSLQAWADVDSMMVVIFLSLAVS